MWNEERHIRACLDSVTNQDYPAERLEVWVFDGGSDDRSWEIAEEVVNARPGFRLMQNPRRTQSAAWNLGIARSTGEVVGIVSAHATLAPDYVRTAVDTLRRTGADLVGGPTIAVSDTFVGRVIAMATSSPYGLGGAAHHYATEESEVDTVFMGLCRRSVYERLGGFDEELVNNQDDDFSHRLRAAGGRIVCNPDISSLYRNRSTFRRLAKQYFRYGYWKVRVFQKYPRMMRPRHFVPAALVASIAALSVLSIIHSIGAAGLAVLLVAYAGWLVRAAVVHRRDIGALGALVLPSAIVVIHLAYGIGFMLGLVRFATRWGDRPRLIPQELEAAR